MTSCAKRKRSWPLLPLPDEEAGLQAWKKLFNRASLEGGSSSPSFLRPRFVIQEDRKRELCTEKTNLEEELRRRKGEKASLEEEVRILREEACSEKASLNEEVRIFREEVLILREEACQEKASLEEEVRILRKEACSEKASLEKELLNLRREVQTQREEARQEKASLKEEVQNRREEVDTEKASLEEEARHLREEVQNCREQAHKEKASLEEVQNRREEVDTEKASLEEEARHLREEVQNCREQAHKVKASLEEARNLRKEAVRILREQVEKEKASLEALKELRVAEERKALKGKSAATDAMEWQFELQGKWESMTSHASDMLLSAYQKYAEKGGDAKVQVTSAGTEYAVDFSTMTQTNVTSGRQRNLRLKFVLPMHWSSSPKMMETFRCWNPLQDVTHESAKMAAVSRLLTASCAHCSPCAPQGHCSPCDAFKQNFRLQQLIQVENFPLWRRCVDQRRQLKGQLSEQQVEPIWPALPDALGEFPSQYGLPEVDASVNEMYLFHGTRWTTATQIAQNRGFEFRVSRAGHYGQGTYFASNACKSHQYARNEHPCTMIVSRVVVGKVWYADKVDTSLRLPPEESCGGRRFDSVVARPGPMPGHQCGEQSHHEIVIFDNAQAYPELIVRYTC